MKNEKKRGSALLLSAILLFVVLALVTSLSYVTVMEQKMSSKTKSSVGSFFNADSGVEWALNKIANTTEDDISDVFSLGPDGGVQPPIADPGYKVYLLDENGKVITTDQPIENVKAVRSVGTQTAGDPTQRAIEAAVGATSIEFKIRGGDYDGCTVACAKEPGFKCAAEFIQDRNYEGSGNPVMRELRACSSGYEVSDLIKQCICYK